MTTHGHAIHVAAAETIDKLRRAHDRGDLTGPMIDTAVRDMATAVCAELESAVAESTAKEAPAHCIDCGEALSPANQRRCPKHINVAAAAEFAKAKAREHGPALVAKAMFGLQGVLASYLSDDKDDKPKE